MAKKHRATVDELAALLKEARALLPGSGSKSSLVARIDRALASLQPSTDLAAAMFEAPEGSLAQVKAAQAYLKSRA